MKWFMPPMPARGSRMQAETHEPSTVTSTSSVLRGDVVFTREHLDHPGTTSRCRRTGGSRRPGYRRPRAALRLDVAALALLTRPSDRSCGRPDRRPGCDPFKRFGVADIEEAAGVELLGEALDQLRLGRAVEIDHDVAAEDGVERPLEGPRLHQIEALERDQRRRLAIDDQRSSPLRRRARSSPDRRCGMSSTELAGYSPRAPRPRTSVSMSVARMRMSWRSRSRISRLRTTAIV